MQHVRMPAKIGLSIWHACSLCVVLPLLAILVPRIDTVEVNGSSPFGPQEGGRPLSLLILGEPTPVPLSPGVSCDGASTLATAGLRCKVCLHRTGRPGNSRNSRTNISRRSSPQLLAGSKAGPIALRVLGMVTTKPETTTRRSTSYARHNSPAGRRRATSARNLG
jgi:hypothetical protein